MAAATALVATSVTCGRIDRGNGEKVPSGFVCGRARGRGCQGEIKENEAAKTDGRTAAGEDEGNGVGKAASRVSRDAVRNHPDPRRP